MTTTGDGTGRCMCPMHRPARAAGLSPTNYWWEVFLHPKNQTGVEHHHRKYVEGCFRCELSRDEVNR